MLSKSKDRLVRPCMRTVTDICSCHVLTIMCDCFRLQSPLLHHAFVGSSVNLAFNPLSLVISVLVTIATINVESPRGRLIIHFANV